MLFRSNAKVAGKEIEQAPGDGSGSVSKITLEQSIETTLDFFLNEAVKSGEFGN